MDAGKFFEILFPIVVFLIMWLISSRSRKARKVDKVIVTKKKGEKAEVSVSPTEVLKQMIFGNIEQPPEVRQVRHLTEESMRVELPQEFLQGFGKEYLEEPLPVFAEEELQRAPKEITPAKELSIELSEKERGKPTKSFFTKKGFSKKDLQKAVVWSEILAPPVGLRNEETT